MDSPAFKPRNVLFAPWRMDYIRSLHKPEPDTCFLCEAAAADNDVQREERVVLWQSEHCVVCMNLFPYMNGHLLVAPQSHVATLDLMSDEMHADMARQTTEAVRLLARAVSAQGFNIGINLGRCAGAGVPGHLHQHVVPRWSGDVNFISVIGEVQIVPQAISQLYRELIKTRAEMLKPVSP